MGAATGLKPKLAAPMIQLKERKLSLSLEIGTQAGATVVHCKGRIVFRDEAALLSQTVGELLHYTKRVILDLEGVTSVDSGGLGELVALHMWAQGCGGTLRLCGLSSRIRHLLQLTNLTSVFEVHATEEDALAACEPEAASIP